MGEEEELVEEKKEAEGLGRRTHSRTKEGPATPDCARHRPANTRRSASLCARHAPLRRDPPSEPSCRGRVAGRHDWAIRCCGRSCPPQRPCGAAAQATSTSSSRTTSSSSSLPGSDGQTTSQCHPQPSCEHAGWPRPYQSCHRMESAKGRPKALPVGRFTKVYTNYIHQSSLTTSNKNKNRHKQQQEVEVEGSTLGILAHE